MVPTPVADRLRKVPGPPPAPSAAPSAERREGRLGVIWEYQLADAAGLWPEQLGLDTCGECDVDDPSGEPTGD